ncbi:MAG: glycosyltransferase family protein [Bdellovibrionales bacterium]|nr:glycosyltransferase family protein [Bdellovibrionales bacterium]
MKTIITIEARMGSSRLPGKVLMESCGKPMLQHMIERLKRCKLADDVVVATTVEPGDDPIIELCDSIGCSYHRGSENNVLQRLIDTAHHHSAAVIVQTTGDSPLIDPRITDKGIEVYRNSSVDYVSSRLVHSYPTGTDTQVYATSVLERVAELTDDPIDQEHGSYYIYTHPELFTMKDYGCDDLNFPNMRWCLDYPEDFKFIDAVYSRLYPTNPEFDSYDILELLKREPELGKINAMHPLDLTDFPYSETLD